MNQSNKIFVSESEYTPREEKKNKRIVSNALCYLMINIIRKKNIDAQKQGSLSIIIATYFLKPTPNARCFSVEVDVFGVSVTFFN